MTEDHERIDELLAGYVLRRLSGEDAAEADQLLSDHVPSCADVPRPRSPTSRPCRAISRWRRLPSTRPRPSCRACTVRWTSPPGRPNAPRGASVAVAASAVAWSRWAGSRRAGSRLSNAETRTGTALEIRSAMRSPGASPRQRVAAGSDAGRTAASSRSPRRASARLYLARGRLSRARPRSRLPLWLGSTGEWTPVGEMFRPDDGVVLARGLGRRRVAVRRGVDHRGGGGSTPTEPNTDGPSWFGRSPSRTAGSDPLPVPPPQICTNPAEREDSPSHAIAAAESTGTSRPQPETAGDHVARPQRAQTDHDQRGREADAERHDQRRARRPTRCSVDRRRASRSARSATGRIPPARASAVRPFRESGRLGTGCG